VYFYENSNVSENSSYSRGLTSGAPQLFSGEPTPRNMLKQLMYFYNRCSLSDSIFFLLVYKLSDLELDGRAKDVDE
jgi:hypothetical protein